MARMTRTLLVTLATLAMACTAQAQNQRRDAPPQAEARAKEAPQQDMPGCMAMGEGHGMGCPMMALRHALMHGDAKLATAKTPKGATVTVTTEDADRAAAMHKLLQARQLMHEARMTLMEDMPGPGPRHGRMGMGCAGVSMDVGTVPKGIRVTLTGEDDAAVKRARLMAEAASLRWELREAMPMGPKGGKPGMKHGRRGAGPAAQGPGCPGAGPGMGGMGPGTCGGMGAGMGPGTGMGMGHGAGCPMMMMGLGPHGGGPRGLPGGGWLAAAMVEPQVEQVDDGLVVRFTTDDSKKVEQLHKAARLMEIMRELHGAGMQQTDAGE